MPGPLLLRWTALALAVLAAVGVAPFPLRSLASRPAVDKLRTRGAGRSRIGRIGAASRWMSSAGSLRVVLSK